MLKMNTLGSPCQEHRTYNTIVALRSGEKKLHRENYSCETFFAARAIEPPSKMLRVATTWLYRMVPKLLSHLQCLQKCNLFNECVLAWLHVVYYVFAWVTVIVKNYKCLVTVDGYKLAK